MDIALGVELEFSEGYVKILGSKVFYRAFGEPDNGTVLCLQGGPGDTHEYLLPMADLAQFGYRVVFFDSVGVGRSQPLPASRTFSLDFVVEQVEAVRRTLGLGRVHLMGNSWGGAYTLVTAMRYPRTTRSLVISSGLASVPLAVREMRKLVEKLPPEVRATIHACEAEGDFDNAAYLRAMQAFDRTFVCRLPIWPFDLAYSFEHMNARMFETMWGAHFLRPEGALRNWDITAQLHRIRLPTLITVGRYDMITPAVARAIHREIRGSRLVIFNNSSHVAMWEERARFIAVVHEFLDRVM